MFCINKFISLLSLLILFKNTKIILNIYYIIEAAAYYFVYFIKIRNNNNFIYDGQIDERALYEDVLINKNV